MSNEPISQQSQSSPSGPPAAPPDVNTQTYPFDLVLHQLNQTASFNIFVTPETTYSGGGAVTDAFNVDGGFVLDVRDRLHRFESVVLPITENHGMKAAAAVGEAEGTFRCRLMVTPDGFEWSPGQEPTAILFDSLRSQQFVLLDNVLTFKEGTDGFRGYAIGRTYPVTVNGQPRLLAGAVGNIMEGFGKLKGLEGTYTFNGTITPDRGLLGDITLRVVDWDRTLTIDSEIAPLTAIRDPDQQGSYIVLRGQKKDSRQRSEYSFGPGGSVQGLITPAQWRSAQYSYTDHGYKGLRSEIRIGQIIGTLDATILANLFGPPGTASKPGFFTTEELYTFVDDDGRTIGTITTGVVLGESFDLKFPALPGQPGLRFAGFGPIFGGTGQFAGVQGILTVNSLIGIMPHALSLMHVFRFIDPAGAFRAGSC